MHHFSIYLSFRQTNCLTSSLKGLKALKSTATQVTMGDVLCRELSRALLWERKAENVLCVVKNCKKGKCLIRKKKL